MSKSLLGNIKVTPVDAPQISMSNAMARSAQGLSLVEKRAVALALSKTDSISNQVLAKASISGWEIKLTAHEYMETFEVEPHTAYEQLKQAADALMHRQVHIKSMGKRGEKVTKINWCGKCTYHQGEGWVEIAFTHYIAPHLLGLRSKFTSYKLAQTGALKSLYSWRLLELLTSWQGTGVWNVDIEDFSDSLEVPETYRKNFKDLRVRVIEPAVKELIEKDDWLIEWTPVKSGRRVYSLSFKFRRNPQGSLPL